MDCREAEDRFDAYLLGALDARERALIDSHLETCRDCNVKLQADGETVAQLAFSVPQLEVPLGVKGRLLDRVDADLRPGPGSALGARVLGLLESFGRGLTPHAGKALASVLVVGLILSGVWFNGRLSQVSQENDDLAAQMHEADARGADVVTRVQDHRYFMYEALRLSTTPGSTVNFLRGTDQSSRARGMMMVSRSGTKGVLLVVDLPPLTLDKVYQVWLVSPDGRKYNSGFFTVDATGYGQAVIIPVVPFAGFNAVEITVEPAGNAAGPTGAGVLKGDL